MASRKMTKEEEVYEELRKELSKGAFAAPRTPSLMKVLKFFFPTIEDAEIGKCVETPESGGRPKTAAEIAKESGKDLERVKEILDRLSKNGCVWPSERPGEPGVLEYVHHGAPAMTDMLGGIGKDGDPESITYREVVNKYHDEGFLMEWGYSKYPVFRTLVVDRPIDANAKVLNYELASDIIKAQEKIAIGYCNCRIRYRKCDHRIDCCFIFGPHADQSVKMSKEVPGARPVKYVSQEEALKLLDECFKEGLVASTSNNSNPKQAGIICMCCPCCCHILGGYASNITGWGNPYQTMKSNFQPKRDEAKCTKCGTCIKLCPVKACWHHYPHKEDLSDDFIFHEEERCIGCGVCAYNCPTEALTMVKVREVPLEPDLISQLERTKREARH